MEDVRKAIGLLETAAVAAVSEAVAVLPPAEELTEAEWFELWDAVRAVNRTLADVDRVLFRSLEIQIAQVA